MRYTDPKWKLTTIGSLEVGREFAIPSFVLNGPMKPSTMMKKIKSKNRQCVAVKLVFKGLKWVEGKEKSSWTPDYPVFITTK